MIPICTRFSCACSTSSARVQCVSGSTCRALKKNFRALHPGPGELARHIGNSIESYHDLVYCIDSRMNEIPPESSLPLVYVRDSRRLYFQKFFFYEQTVMAELGRLIKRRGTVKADPAHVRRMIKSVLEEKPLFFGGSPAVLNPSQVMALCLSVTSGFTVISGGPGTGKTSIVLNILRLFSRAGIDPGRMMVAAPTGRAAQRLTESVRRGLAGLANRDEADSALERIEAVTVHRLLKYSPSRNAFLFNRNNRLKADLLIIDEVSMIDIVLLGKLLGAVDDNTTLILLGDKNQLPSVEAGAVLADLMPGERVVRYSSGALAMLSDASPSSDISSFEKAGEEEIAIADHFVILGRSYRSEKSILDAAERINRQDASALDRIPLHEGQGPLPAQGIHRIDPGAEGRGRRARFYAVLEKWAAMNFGTRGADDSYASLVRRAESFTPDDFASEEFGTVMRAMFRYIEGSRILSPVRRGDFGAAEINTHMTAIMAAMNGREAAADGPSSGLPVIVGKNDYGRELFNGDVGLVLRAGDGCYYAFFTAGAGLRYFPLQLIPAHEPAWAITVHKSQGSEYDRVLIAVDERAERLLTREIIYTAVTRARSLALIFGDRPSLAKAFASNASRDSGIDLAAIV